MGVLAQNGGNLPEAINDFSQLVSVQPTDVPYLLLARALEQSGRVKEAQAARAEAERVSTDLSQARQKVEQLLSH
jgi:predicted Zn-dependent protease